MPLGFGGVEGNFELAFGPGLVLAVALGAELPGAVGAVGAVGGAVDAEWALGMGDADAATLDAVGAVDLGGVAVVP